MFSKTRPVVMILMILLPRFLRRDRDSEGVQLPSRSESCLKQAIPGSALNPVFFPIPHVPIFSVLSNVLKSLGRAISEALCGTFVVKPVLN